MSSALPGSLSNLKFWIAGTNFAFDLGADVTDSMQVQPAHAIDTFVGLGKSNPQEVLLGEAYNFVVPSMVWDTAAESLGTSLAQAEFNVVLFDTVQGWCLMCAAEVAEKPSDMATSDPATTIRTNLILTPPESTNNPVFKWSFDAKGIYNRKVILGTGGGKGIIASSNSATATAGDVSLDNAGTTLTLDNGLLGG